MKYINKTIFINYLRCPTLGWMTKRNMIPRSRGINNRFLKFEREIIQRMSQQLFSNGINAWESKTDIAALYTKELIFNPNVKTIYEASFIVSSYLAKIDILKKCDDKMLSLFEVKSSTNYKFKYINDISFDAMVLAKAGINVQKCVLLYLSNDYRLGMDVSKFFRVLDCTEKVKLKTNEFLNLSDEVFEVIKSKNIPRPYLKKNCKNCPVFDRCIGKDVKNHIFDLPRLSSDSIEKLIALGVDTICKVPSDFELTKIQKIVKNCVLTGVNYVSEDLETHIHSIKQPFYYLDFESVSMAMPLYECVGPHTQLLTQFSIDRADISGNILDHYEYIVDQRKDCRREVTEKFIEYLGSEGSIITYANFERNFILKLIGIFPDLSEKLDKIVKRIVDIELIIRENYYNINFHGRSSIKKVLPVLIPELNYSHLKIRNGRDAVAAFAFMAMGVCNNKKIEQTKNNLLKYCAMDTLAMVHIHQFLIDVVNM
ncbi:MAG: hypothetical protein Nk1A_1160 [Endomicrobiia bacterium]|nr:MAG: hypothetical protein Nk1A_1160 [Endomicrobiia bacterium]